jgi:predicted lipase
MSPKPVVLSEPRPEFKFNPYTTHYEPQNAYWLAEVAHLAYRKKSKDDESPDEDAILEQLKSLDGKFKDVKGFNKKSSQAIIILNEGDNNDSNPGYVLIAFRGTDEPDDWLDNVKVLPIDFPSNPAQQASDQQPNNQQPADQKPLGKIHQGFYNAFLDIWDEMDKLLRLPEYKKRPFWITGHSLGGALATVAGLQLTYESRPFYGIYTFGQPRVCDRDLMRHFNAEHQKIFFRFQNDNDIVTRIPAAIAGYSHVGTYMHILQNKTIVNDYYYSIIFVLVFQYC